MFAFWPSRQSTGCRLCCGGSPMITTFFEYGFIAVVAELTAFRVAASPVGPRDPPHDPPISVTLGRMPSAFAIAHRYHARHGGSP